MELEKVFMNEEEVRVVKESKKEEEGGPRIRGRESEKRGIEKWKLEG